MSLRAIRKREKANISISLLPAVPPRRHKKLIHLQKQLNRDNIEETNYILQKKSNSYPEIKKNKVKFTSKLNSKSETDLTKLELVNSNSSNQRLSGANAKSEVCLVKISSHQTQQRNQMISTSSRNFSRSETNLNDQVNNNISNNMRNIPNNGANNNQIRRMSENSVSSTPSSIMITSGEYEARGFADTSQVQIPIVGYEVMEERARFTVYKLRVENPFANNCWLVLRRYTDFVRLNAKMKQLFPTFNLQLPRKKIFGDNFNAVFLDNRVQGLQIFVNSIMANEQLRNSKIVREFFCLDEAPTYSESMEEFRAIFEAQEETIAHLKLQINSKNDLIISLQQKLMNEISENEKLKNVIKSAANECTNCCKKLETLDI